MDKSVVPLAERNVFKRPMRSDDAENETVVKKPALLNPLQDINSNADQKPAVLTKEIAPVKPAVAPTLTMQQIVDEHDRNVQLNFSPYAQRIVNSWLKTEDKFRCLPNYLDGQTDVKSYMRETLIDWIVDVNSHFRHRRETLYLCVNIIDRYVAATIREKKDMVSRSNYQLVGVTAYLIASKYEEIYYPEIRMILQFADNIYSEEDVKKMELKIINTLKYDLTVPTTNKFLGRFLRLSSNNDVHYMCYFICDRMLQSISMLAWKPSVQAAAAIYLARKYFGYTDSWNKAFEEFTGIKKSELIGCASAIHSIIMKPNKLHACENKYKGSRFNHIYNSIPHKTKCYVF